MMSKPNQSKLKISNNYKDSGFRGVCSEQVLLEAKPNILLYTNKFIFKIVVLFLLVFLFAPIMTLFYSIQDKLLTSFQLNFTNMSFIMELILLFCILIVIIKILLDVLDWKYTTYTLTNQRILIQRGFFRKEKIMMPYIKVQDIEVSQTIFERLLTVGDIVIYGGHDNSDTILDNIPNPKKVEEIILSHLCNIYQQNNSNYDPNYNPGYDNNSEEYNNSKNYNRNQQSDKMDYSQNNHNNHKNNKKNVHYYNNNDIDYYNEFEDEHNEKSYDNSNYGGYKDKWQKNKGNYKKSEMNNDEIIRKHQEMFKKHNKK